MKTDIQTWNDKTQKTCVNAHLKPCAVKKSKKNRSSRKKNHSPCSKNGSPCKNPSASYLTWGDTLLTYLKFDPEAGHCGHPEHRQQSTGIHRHRHCHTHQRTQPRPHTPPGKAQVEFHPHIIQRHVYEALHITFDRTPEEVERTFWRAATSWEPEPGVEYVLEILRNKNNPWASSATPHFAATH